MHLKKRKVFNYNKSSVKRLPMSSLRENENRIGLTQETRDIIKAEIADRKSRGHQG